MTVVDLFEQAFASATSIDERKHLLTKWGRAVVRTLGERRVTPRHLRGPRRLDDVVAFNRQTGDVVLRFVGYWRKIPTGDLLALEERLAFLAGRA